MSNESTKPKLILPTSEDLDRSKLHQRQSKDYYRLREYFVAAGRNENDTVMKCLESGIHINAYDLFGKTIFHIAAVNGNVELIEMVINWPGRDLNLRTLDFQLTPLHEAVLCERIEIVNIFLHHGAKINLINGNGETAVHLAVKLSTAVILKLLMSYKANLNVVDVFSNTPLSLAMLCIRNKHICGLLLRHGARVNKNRPAAMYLFHEAVLDCIRKEDVVFLKLLVEYGAFINYVDVDGRNAMHYAAIAGIITVLEYLISIGVKATLKDKTSRTPYDIAFEHGNEEAVIALTPFLETYKQIPRMSTDSNDY